MVHGSKRVQATERAKEHHIKQDQERDTENGNTGKKRQDKEHTHGRDMHGTHPRT
jgi:hypothetical protein